MSQATKVADSDDDVDKDWGLDVRVFDPVISVEDSDCVVDALQRDLEGDAGPKPKFENIEVECRQVFTVPTKVLTFVAFHHLPCVWIPVDEDRQTITDDLIAFQHGPCL